MSRAKSRFGTSEEAQRGAYEPLDYEVAKRLVASSNTEDRVRVAGAADAKPEMLYFLAGDPAETVRAAVAMHQATPRKADLILATDESSDVRLHVARKVTTQISALPESENAQLWDLTVAVLEALAKDDVTAVRGLVAQLASRVERVPASLALSLAKDVAVEVAEPALAYPGGFADAEMIEIVAGAQDPRIAAAVARRPNIGAPVAQAVVATGDSGAISALLANKSADIPETTLTSLVDRAAGETSWHEPLVTRPRLTDRLAVSLAGIVSGALGLILRKRSDLSPATQDAIGKAIGAAATAVTPTEDSETPTQRAKRLQANGTLDEDCLCDAMGTDPDFLVAALALRTGESPVLVRKILAANTAKALVALAWKSGFSTRLSSQLQTRVAHLPPKARIAATSGQWPLSQDEMDWQIDFFRTLVPKR